MEQQLRQDDVLRKQQKNIHDGRNWTNMARSLVGLRESDNARFAEIDRLFLLRYDNARDPVNVVLKNRIQMKQQAYETKKDDYLGITFAPKKRSKSNKKSCW